MCVAYFGPVTLAGIMVCTESLMGQKRTCVTRLEAEGVIWFVINVWVGEERGGVRT